MKSHSNSTHHHYLNLGVFQVKKAIILSLILCLTIFNVFAGLNSTIPLDHRVYDVLKNAQLRGLIEPISSAKPYIVKTVTQKLSDMLENPQSLTASERQEIEDLIKELTPNFKSSNDFSSIMTQGSYKGYSEETDIGLEFGMFVDAELTTSLIDASTFDSRNSGTFYFRSDIKDFLSIYMDLGVRIDKLDNNVFLATDFTIPGEGNYFNPLKGGRIVSVIPTPGYNASGSMRPEISSSFLDGRLQFRWGAYARDWGPGMNNLQLSGTARPFDALEAHFEFSDWIKFSFLTGSLGTFSLKFIGDDEFFSDVMQYRNDAPDDETPYGNFQTAISSQRIEVSLPWNFTFGIYESVLYQKRFELGYLNPFNVYMLQQNATGDYDNMLAGVDIQWQIQNIGKIYGGMVTTEMHEMSPDVFLTHPRNIMGLQAGINVAVPLGLFSNVTLQYTQLDPFLYSHYRHKGDKLHPSYQNGDPEYYIETAYVNKGENIGYPLNPNSDEILLHADVGLGNGWETSLTVKYQRRSAQYGYLISQAMQYDTVTYELESFTEHLFKKTLHTKIGVSKKFKDFPFTIHGSYQFQRILSRDIINSNIGIRVEDDGNSTIIASNWNNPEYMHAVQIGFTIYR